MRLSTTLPVLIGATPAELERRADALGAPGTRMLAAGVTGTAGDVVRRLEELAEAGTDTDYFHLYAPADVDHIRLLGAEVVSRF